MPNKIIKLNSISDFENFVAHSPPCAKEQPERREPGIFEKGVPYSERLKTYLEYSRSRGNISRKQVARKQCVCGKDLRDMRHRHIQKVPERLYQIF